MDKAINEAIGSLARLALLQHKELDCALNVARAMQELLDNHERRIKELEKKG